MKDKYGNISVPAGYNKK